MAKDVATHDAAKEPAKLTDGTVGKALFVLETVAGFERPVRFSELLAGLDLPKATLYRLLQTLTNQNMLSYDPERQLYSLGIRLMRLAHGAWRQASLAPIARHHLDKLACSLSDTIHLAQLDNGQVLYVDKRNAAASLDMYSDAGKIGPSYCTGVGKAMLAFLSDGPQSEALGKQAYYPHTPNTLTSVAELKAELTRIRASGVAYDREEHEPNIICVAVPILTESGRLIGALSLTNSSRQRSIQDLEEHLPQLTKTADDIGREAQDWLFPVSALEGS